MDDFDITNQLKTTRTLTDITWWGMAAIIMATIALAYYKRERGGNYKLVIAIGTVVTILYLILMSYIVMSSVQPIYNLN